MMERTPNIKSLSFAVLAFVLAGVAQIVLGGMPKVMDASSYGWLIYLVAAIPFLLAFGRMSVTRFALNRLSEASETPSRLSLLQQILLGFAILAALLSLVLFGNPGVLSKAWIVHVISLLLFISAFISFKKSPTPSSTTDTAIGTRFLYSFLIIAVFALATFARLWQLSGYPFGSWYDESINGLAAAQILNDPNFRPIFVDTMPSHFIYMITFAFSIFSVNPFALRLVTAVFGIAGVVFAYLLFRRWFGTSMGIVAACLLAVMRYSLTYSRFGVNAISVPAFELAALYFLDRALTEKKIADFAWLGITLGFGLSFYTAFRLFPFVLGIFLFILFVVAIKKFGWSAAVRNYVRGLLPHWSITLLALVITLLPVIFFIAQDSNEFFSRTGTVSIFNHRDEPDLGRALWSNTRKHLEMFNVAGDRNGRHNLPGAPMLDPVMGALFILGIVYALWRWRDLPNLIMLLVFLLMIQSGVLSLDFEAPQSLRAIGVIPAVLYFITLPLAAITKSIQGLVEEKAGGTANQSSPFRLTYSTYWQAGLAVLLAIITYLNFNTFFNKQKNDPSAWAQHSAAETLIANILTESSGGNDFILSAMYDGHPTVRFLTGDVKNYQAWTVTDRFPLVRDSERGVIILFDEKLLPAYRDLQRIYPNVTYIEHHAPMGGGTVLYQANLSPNDLHAAQGVVASYYAGGATSATPAKEETLTQVSLDWNNTQPSAQPFVAELRSTLFITEDGQYTFSLRDAPEAEVWIDENPIADEPVTLARGTHTLRVQVPGNTGKFELWWQTPTASEAQPVPAANLFNPSITNSGLLGEYYPTPDWNGEPAFAQVDPQLAFYFHIIPLPRPYSVKWTGKLYIPTDGEYTFALESVDGSKLLIDDQVVVDNPEGRTTVENRASFKKGWHDITVFFSDKTGSTHIYLYWTPPGASERELIPPRYFSPPMGAYPTPTEAEQ